MVSILNAHSKIIIGQERYKDLIKDHVSEITPALFTKSRFFDFRERDTNLLPTRIKHVDKLYNELEEKFENDDLAVVGDKIPFLYRRYQEVAGSIPNVKFIFLVRDLRAVADSYRRRCDDPNDSWKRNVNSAISDWTEAMQATAACHENELTAAKLLVVGYEDFYSGEIQELQRVLQFLNLSLDKSVVDRYRAMTTDWECRRDQVTGLSEEEIAATLEAMKAHRSNIDSLKKRYR